MQPLTIEIHGTGTNNRGAELMAIAIAQRMRSTFPGCRIVVPPEFGPIESAVSHDFRMTTEFGHRLVNRLYGRVMPSSIQRKLGLVHPSEVDVVLDASGFSFSDQWGPRSANRLTSKMATTQRKNQRLILLPQAFGPFHSREVASATRRLLQRASLVYARDQRSLEYLKSLNSAPKQHLCPDFTYSVKPKEANIDLPRGRIAAIVPNARMMDKSSSFETYPEFLSSLIPKLIDRNFQPIFLIHDTKDDHGVLDRLGSKTPQVPRLTHPDPRVLKWALGKSSIVIGSRFHALVSAFSQGIPCIGTGWSHKYQALFHDFDCSDMLLEDLEDKAKLTNLLCELSDSRRWEARSFRIQKKGNATQECIENMWLAVEAIISTHVPNTVIAVS